MQKYHIITFGCQMNISDSERIAGFLKKMKYEKTSDINEADLIVVNMCSVRQSAVDRIWGLTLKFKEQRAVNNRLRTILTGCILGPDFEKFKPHFDYILSIKTLPYWKEILKKEKFYYYPNLRKLEPCNELKRNYLEIEPLYFNNFSAFIPISTGCNNFCSYCVVPYARGLLACKDYKSILKEIQKLVKKNFKEFWLLGQNVNDYHSPLDPLIDFPELLRLINEIPGDFWVRFTSPHPKNFSEKLIKALAESEKITEYLNLPVQSGDNNILKKMNRSYTISSYKKLVKKLKVAIPEICLSTDVIVGFPGETKKQFENTAKLFKDIKFDMAYIAEYSPRARTNASKIKDSISKKEKVKRRKILTEILKKTVLQSNKKYIGKNLDILVEQEKNGFLFGKTRTCKVIKFEGKKKLIGNFVRVKVTGATYFGLKGKSI